MAEIWLIKVIIQIKAYRFGATGLWCLSSLATVIGKTEYSSLLEKHSKTLELFCVDKSKQNKSNKKQTN